MLPLVCNDAVAILFMFDLSRKSTLISIKEWFRQARGFNKARHPSHQFALTLSLPLCSAYAHHGLPLPSCAQSVVLSDFSDGSVMVIAQSALPFLIGTKYDLFATFPKEEQEEITKQVRP